MSIEFKKENDIYIIMIRENLSLTNTVEFRKQIVKLIENGVNKIIFDFENAKYIDSTGITALLVIHSKMTKKGVRFRITNLKKSVKNIFDIHRLNQILPISSTTETAISELNR